MNLKAKTKAELIALCEEQAITIDGQKQLADAVEAKDLELVKQAEGYELKLKGQKKKSDATYKIDKQDLINISNKNLQTANDEHAKALKEVEDKYTAEIGELKHAKAEYERTLNNAYNLMNKMVLVTESIIDNNNNLLKNIQGATDNAIELGAYAAAEFRRLVPAPPKSK